MGVRLWGCMTNPPRGAGGVSGGWGVGLGYGLGLLSASRANAIAARMLLGVVSCHSR